MNYTIFHNSNCQKSRSSLQYLRSKNIEPKIIEYLKDKPFTSESLKEILNKLGLNPIDIVKTQESVFKQNYKGKNLSDDQWLKILVENPKLIRRPIIVKGEKAILGDIIEYIDTLL